MKIKRLKNRLSFIKKINEVDENGVANVVNEELFSCWCEVSKPTIKEFKNNTMVVENQGLNKSKDTKVFVIRSKQKREINTNMLVLFKGIEYGIDEIQPDDQYEELTLLKVSVTK